MSEQPKPPVAPIKPITDDYFGTKVTDNYRYMENFKDEEVQNWVKAQADFTTHVLTQLPERNTFFNRMSKPVLLRIDYEAGHGAGSTKMQRFQERADIFTFMMWQFGMEGEK